MAGMKVTIKPAILNWILQKIQFENVASSTLELLTKWQSGEKTPTFNQVEDVSRKINIPFGYFFLDTPPVENCPILEYRTVNSVAIPEPSRNLIDTYDQMVEMQEWMTEYLQENGYEELSFGGIVTLDTPVNIIVKAIREHLNLNVNWFASCKTATEAYKLICSGVEEIGVLVMSNGIVGNNTRRKLNVDEFRAFTVVNKNAPLIFINNCDTETGKLFSIMHEFTHVLLGVNSLYNDGYGHEENRSNIEKICNAAAAEVLVPSAIFNFLWDKTDETISAHMETVAGYFHCSRYVIARKALDQHKISRKTYDETVKELDKQFKAWEAEQSKNKSGGGNFYRTMSSRLDHRFIRALAQSAEEGRTQYTDLFRMTNTNRRTFQKLLNEIGGAGW